MRLGTTSSSSYHGRVGVAWAAERAPTWRPLIIAHRGGEPAEPDNSPQAFAAALAAGVDALEFDVQRAGDGPLVLFHDAVVRRDGVRRKVASSGLSELRELVPWLLTLDQFLEQFGRHLPLNLDMKATGFESDVVEALRRHGLTAQTLVSSKHIWSLRRLRQLAPEIPVGLSRGHLASSVPGTQLKVAASLWLQLTLPLILFPSLRLADAQAVMLQHRVITPRLVRALRQRGYGVFTWTVDDEADVWRVSRAGVDGLASNVPARITALFDSR